MRATRLLTGGAVVAGIAAFALASSPTLSAQAPAARQQTQPTAPGWVFTPSIAVAETWDDNVLLRGEGSGSISDFLTAVSPRGSLGYRGRRTTLHLDYRGSYYLYQELSDLNAFDQRGAADFRQRLTSAVSVFARQSFAKSPTTDDVDLPGVEFRRLGVLHNDFRSGLEARLSSRTMMTGSYTFQQVKFDDDPLLPVDELHGGGHAHGALAQVEHRLRPRISIGGEFEMRHATVDDTNGFDVQNTMGTVDYRVAQRLQVSGGAGYAWLSTSDEDVTRRAPAFRIGLSGSGARIAWNIGYRKSFLPSFGFGGTFENQEFTAGFLAPLNRRLDWSGSVAVRESDPLVASDLGLGLRSTWARTSISYLATRWVRIEGFYTAVFQDSQRAGGRVNRSRAGVQVVTYKRLRVR